MRSKRFLSAVCAAVMALGAAAALPEGSIKFDNSIIASAETFGDYEYTVLDDGTVEISNYNGTETEISIPSEIDGKIVTSIGDWAFDYCTSLTSVTIPNSVKSIGDDAFCDCTSLESVTIPDSVTSIGGWAFDSCESLTSVTIPDSVTSIGESAFRYCTSLTSITIPNSVTSIGDGAFSVCTSLTSIDVDVDNVKYSSIDGILYNKEKNELIYCPDGKESVTIPNSVTSVGDHAFYHCTHLESITIPDGVESIGEYAFYDCWCLTSVTIPDSVTSVGDNAFKGTPWFKNNPLINLNRSILWPGSTRSQSRAERSSTCLR